MKTPCPITQLWQGIYDRSDKAASDALMEHAQICRTCRAEVIRFNAENENRHGPIAEFLSDFATGCCVLAAFVALRGILRNQFD
ncbi:MAG: hypothetical protein WCI73_12420, partial [Phycisphaerae bacterium]